MKNTAITSKLILLSLAVLFACQSTNQEAIKLKQYQIHGKELYELHCLNCHQSDGSGLGLLIPPIDSSFILGNQALIICGIKNGLKGPISVNGKNYDREMPANARLTSLEIAEIMTYIQSNWAKKDSIVEISTIQKSLNSCN
ncbi:c-type cytochrome [Reichenbachiella ulvae]|uniref:Cytochrome c n=1 Tax=Reichenbachiella ulvae TaxID=2980104 RepID=A0ABT3CST7_9BACT|nr:cytochrome c [Reichenbachiella ulvae]MCV9386770.1 cytochrome c [Reichenbachiella ulvae]